MELTEKELKELDNLSLELKGKIEAMFNSPFYKGFRALSSQYEAYCNELEKTPFTINGNEDWSGYAENPNVDKIINAMSATARAKAETSLKIAKEIPELAESIQKLQGKLSNDEKMLEDAKTKKKIEKSGTQIAIKRS